METKTMQFQVKFEDAQKVNPLFSKCKIYTLYTGINRNNSYMSKDSVENAIKTLFNIPIVGEFIEETDNFGGHGGKIELDDKGIRFIQTTKPFGVVPESAKVYWENVTEQDGTINEYLVIEDAYLWTGRYEETSDLLNNTYGQSMEIEIIDGNFTTIDDQQVYEIKDFIFSALCILGIDKDGEGLVEPCFESSSITAYSLDKDEFKKQFNQMIAELKFSIQQSNLLDVDINKVNNAQVKGGTNVDEVLEMLKKYNLTLEDLTTKEIDQTQYSLTELEAKVQEVFPTEPVVPATDFTLTARQLVDGLCEELEEIETVMEEYWGEIYTYPRYCYKDSLPEQNVVIAMDQKSCNYVGFNYSVKGDSVEVDVASLTAYKIDYNPMDLTGAEPDDTLGGGNDDTTPSMMSLAKSEFMLQAKEKHLAKQFEAEKEKVTADSKVAFDALQSELNTLKEQYSTLEERANSLESDLANKAKQEREDAETAIFESFSAELTDAEMEPVKSKSAEMSLDDIETKLFALVGKKKAKLSFSKVEDKPLRMSIPTEIKKGTDKEYADLIEKYSNR